MSVSYTHLDVYKRQVVRRQNYFKYAFHHHVDSYHYTQGQLYSFLTTAMTLTLLLAGIFLYEKTYSTRRFAISKW